MHPRENYELIGHEAAEAAFLDVWKAGRTAHAWLITGPEGIGKATFAYRIARFVLSGGAAEEPKDAGASLFGDELPAVPVSLAVDPELPVCQQVEHGSHPDFRVLEPGMINPDTGRPTQQIVVGQVRAALGVTGMTAAGGGWRVVIVDPAEMLNVNAANAILKNLEEPPPKTLFLLVSHAPGRLLPTIRSRCRRLDLKPLGSEQVADLARRFGEVPASELEAVAKLAGGSVGKAIQLGNADGLALYEAMFRATESLPSLDMVSVHKLGDLVARKRSGTDETDSFPVLAGLICDWLAGLVLAGARGGEGPEVIAGERQLRARLLAMAPLDRWFEVWEKVGELLRSADGINLNRKQVIIESFSMIAGAVSGRTA